MFMEINVYKEGGSQRGLFTGTVREETVLASFGREGMAILDSSCFVASMFVFVGVLTCEF